MPRTWATWGGDLHVDVSGTRVRTGLERSLRDAIRAGRLHPGTRLPSSRALAQDLGLARNTIGEAYAQLIAEGWLASRQGAGTWVAEIQALDRARAIPPAPPRSIREAETSTPVPPTTAKAPRTPT